MSMLGHFEELLPSPERRHWIRRALKLGAGSSEAQVTILDLSLTGALLETNSPILVGAQFEVELPNVGAIPASIVWNSGDYYGCQFDLPITPATLSAALLQAAPREASDGPPDPVEELRELNAEIERLSWQMHNALKLLERK
jgi:hypothetical protein